MDFFEFGKLILESASAVIYTLTSSARPCTTCHLSRTPRPCPQVPWPSISGRGGSAAGVVEMSLVHQPTIKVRRRVGSSPGSWREIIDISVFTCNKKGLNKYLKWESMGVIYNIQIYIYIVTNIVSVHVSLYTFYYTVYTPSDKHDKLTIGRHRKALENHHLPRETPEFHNWSMLVWEDMMLSTGQSSIQGFPGITPWR